MTKSRSSRNRAEAAPEVVREEGPDVEGGEAPANSEASDLADTQPDAAPAEDDRAELATKLNELTDRHLRLAAEFTNFRRRSEQERLETWSRAQADLIAKFLDLLDDLQRVADLDLDNATVETITEGVDLVERKFVRTLSDVGVEVLDPRGQPFDPEVMEAVMREPTDSPDADDSVAQVFQKGYMLKGILVRPARVSVYKHG